MSANSLTVAAIQWRFAWATADATWEVHWSSLVGQAAVRGAQLVALPAHAGDALLAIQHPELAGMPLWAGLAHAWQSAPSDVDGIQGRRLWEDYTRFFGQLAAQYDVMIAAGSLLLPDEDGMLTNQSCLFGRDGAVIGVQRAGHRSPAERALGVAAGDRLDAIETAAGIVGLVVGEDLYYPEVARILTLQGAEVLIAPTQRRFAGETGYLAGLWRDVQGNQVFGLEACLIGVDAVPAQAVGSLILCPAELTGDTRGVVAAAATADDSEVVSGDLDLAARHRLFERYDISRYFNPALYAGQLSKAYP